MDQTTRLLLNKPNGDPVSGDVVDIDILNANADKIDATISFTVCTSTGRPAVPFQGQGILETDTGNTLVWGGSSWLPFLMGPRVGIGRAASGIPQRLLQTLGGGGGATSQVFLETSASASGHRAIATQGNGDAGNRWWIDFDGSMQWAPASGNGDVSLQRPSPNTLRLDGFLALQRGGSGDWSYGTQVTGDSYPRMVVLASGSINWGPGSVGTDARLSRTGAWLLETNSTLDVLPPQGAASKAFGFNHGYGLFVDNAGVGGAANARMWIDVPNGGDFIIGPRAGSSFITQLRLRTNATTASAANMHLDAGSFQVMRSTSSLKYKVRVEDVNWDHQKLLQLRPVCYRDRNEYAEKGEESRQYVGLIAEEVDALGFQEFIHYDGEGNPDGVQYERLTVALLDIVKDLASRVEALEART